jgi:hypothetical protein
MVQTIDAVFDGTVLRPDKPLSLSANTRVRVTVETLPAEPVRPTSFLRTARSLKLDGPADWSANFEQYLEGEQNEPVG